MRRDRTTQGAGDCAVPRRGLGHAQRVGRRRVRPLDRAGPAPAHNGEKLAARLIEEGADILIVESDSVKGPVFDLRCSCIGSCRGDPNNVDVEAATKAGIPVLRAPGRNADAVAEITIALMFAVNRFIVPADHDVRADQVYAGGKIPYQRYRAWQLAGRTAGIVGLGAVGPRREVALRRARHAACSSFDPYNPEATHHTADELHEMLAECDVVSMHAMVTPETERLMGAAQFAAMKPGSIYVNSARALLHDTDALVDVAAVGPPRRRGPRPLRGRAPAARPSAVRDEQRRAHAAHRRRDLRHRSEPLEAHRRRRRAASCAARSRSTA